MITRTLFMLLVLGALVIADAPAYAQRPLVVASFYPLCEFSRQVAGDHAEVVSLVPPGVEPHEPRSARARPPPAARPPCP
jgi:ABC-type Zn uptake system ZnuABC Zn-binding protein ZnuA